MKTITSGDNPHFKALLKLAQSSRERRLAGLSLLDGVHLLQVCIAHGQTPEEVVVSDSGADNPEIATLLQGLTGLKQDMAVLRLRDAMFNELSSVATPTGILSVIRTPRRETPPETLETCVMLDDVQDPGNLGSILRSCAAAGVRQVFLSTPSVNAWSPRVLRAAMGAHFMTAVYERMDLQTLAGRFPGQVLVTQQHAPRLIYEADLGGTVALVFGNEGAGVSPVLARLAHGAVAIPMPGQAESLNVAAAAAICLYERVRQQRNRPR